MRFAMRMCRDQMSRNKYSAQMVGDLEHACGLHTWVACRLLTSTCADAVSTQTRVA